MRTGPYRVVVWSTGGIGSIAVNTIRRRADLELVGVWAHSPDKIGRDVGEILGGDPIGVVATGNVDALIDLKPDCVVYAAKKPNRDADAVLDYVRLLSAGINVVSTAATPAVYPAVYRKEWRDALTEACKTGKTSFYASGIEPGFAADHLPLLLSTMSSRITKVHSYEIGLYDDYPVADVMMNAMGFGQPMDFVPLLSKPGAILMSWAGTVQMVADALGVKLDDIREVFERSPTSRTLDVACGRLEAGTCGALRIQAIGVVDGKDAIVLEHVTRMARDLAPEWAQSSHDVGYRVVIEGSPSLQCDLGFWLDDPKAEGIAGMEAGAGAMVATAMRVVNAIPYVVDAEPGMHGALDLPLTTPRTAFTPAS